MTTKSSPRGAVITGGGSGIGRQTAHSFADQGWNVLIVGRTESGPA
ncbi:SDR family NAD(P)-dependent oxidoreductase [Micromonospora sp. NPDC005324]